MTLSDVSYARTWEILLFKYSTYILKLLTEWSHFFFWKPRARVYVAREPWGNIIHGWGGGGVGGFHGCHGSVHAPVDPVIRPMVKNPRVGRLFHGWKMGMDKVTNAHEVEANFSLCNKQGALSIQEKEERLS